MLKYQKKKLKNKSSKMEPKNSNGYMNTIRLQNFTLKSAYNPLVHEKKYAYKTIP